MLHPAPVRLLLVEDDHHIARFLTLAMSELGVPYTLDNAISAEEALELWSQRGYDMLITDYNLRGKTGVKLIVELKAQGVAVPTILFTAYDSPQVRREATEAGVNAFVPKPFVIDDFIAVVRKHLPFHAQVVGGPNARN